MFRHQPVIGFDRLFDLLSYHSPHFPLGMRNERRKDSFDIKATYFNKYDSSVRGRAESGRTSLEPGPPPARGGLL